MRRFSLLICLFFLASAVLFSQAVRIGRGTLTFSSIFATGIMWEADNVVKYDNLGARIAANNNYFGYPGKVHLNWVANQMNDERSNVRGDLLIRYSNGNLGGFRVRFRTNEANINGAITWPEAYAWMDLMSNSIRILGGKISGYSPWGTGMATGALWGEGEEWNMDAVGALVEIKPFSFPSLKPKIPDSLGTLDFGSFFILPNTANTNTVYDKDMKAIPGGGELTPLNILKETALGMRWTHKYFRFSFMYKFDGDADNASASYPAPNNNIRFTSSSDDSALYFGLQLLNIPGFTFSTVGAMLGLGNFDARGRGQIREQVEYTFVKSPDAVLSNLSVGIKAYQKIWGYNLNTWYGWDAKMSPYLMFRPYVAYSFTRNFRSWIETGIGFGHDIPSNAGLNLSTTNVIVNEKLHLYARPTVMYTMANGMRLKAWYKISYIEYANISNTDPALAYLAHQPIPRTKDGIPVISLTQQQIALMIYWEF